MSSADYGTNGGLSLTRPALPPERSDDVLVTSLEYGLAGRLQWQTDPRGIVTGFTYDARDRQMLVTQNARNCPAGSQTDVSATLAGTPLSEDMNVTVETKYNADGNVVSINASNRVTGNQLTQYVYGVERWFPSSGPCFSSSSSATPSGGVSFISSTLLKAAEIYPDAADGADRISFAYNRQGEVIRLEDQNATVHEYVYDLLGRQTQDRVTQLGEGVDGSVRRIETSYEVRGMRNRIMSLNTVMGGTGSASSDILFIYNDFGQVASDYQSLGGAVDTSTTPRVQYGYANGSGNTIRPTSLTYPDGRVITYQYGLTNSSSDALSRIDTLSDSLGSSDLQTYQYLGVGSFVSSDSLGAEVRWQLYSPDGSFDPDTGDIYTGLDRFGRVKDNRWYGYGGLVPQDVDRYRYGYDRNGNRIWKENLIAGISSLPFDEQYGYDHLDRLQQMDRGLFDENHKLQDQSFAQNWSLDATGNWRKCDYCPIGQ